MSPHREWFTVQPSDPPLGARPFIVPLPDEGQGATMLIFGGLPDVVRLPPDLGGEVVPLLGMEQGVCPRCHRPATRYTLDHPRTHTVTACAAEGQMWWETQGPA